ncbi:hypothetical protein QTP88_001825 [Uroleucon formosanum]
MRDLNHLNDRMKKHDLTVKHMNNTLNLATLGKTNILSMLDSGYRRGIELHNEKVSNNRYILNLIINCIRFCGAFELALRGHDEKDTSLNPGIFRGLISFSAELDSALKVHLEKATVFKGTSKTIQNELLKCMLNICQQEISLEIKKADYLSITADETTDVSAIFQMVIVYRYIVKDKVVERFWGFLKPKAHNSEELAECIKEQLDQHIGNATDKLIAQTYDGASVMSGNINGVQAKIKLHYPNANYVHCYAHQLNLVMANAASINRNTIEQASGLKRTLLDDVFIYWLTVFHSIMPHVDILYNQLQKRETDSTTVKNNINSFIKEISKIRNQMGTLCEGNIVQSNNKRKHRGDELKREAIEVCDNIIPQIKQRFDFTGHLVASNLFLADNFEKYDDNFPEGYFNETINVYPYFDSKKLKTEIQIIYSRTEFRTMSGAVSLLSFIQSENLTSTFGESMKLLKIIITIPMSTAESERCFSTLKRIKTFLRNTMHQERLSALAMLSIEKNFVMHIADFNNKVMELFASSKERRLDFTFKNF